MVFSVLFLLMAIEHTDAVSPFPEDCNGVSGNCKPEEALFPRWYSSHFCSSSKNAQTRTGRTIYSNSQRSEIPASTRLQSTQICIFKEINKENDAVFREIKLSSDAYLELIDRALPTNSDELATCKLNANDPNLYSAAYLTPWLVKNDVKAFPTEPVDELNEIRFRNNFIITKHELWNCERRGSKKKFIRSILEYIGREPVKTLRYTNHLNLWTFVLNLKKQLQSIAVRDVSYFNEKLERVSYYGQIQEDKAKYKDVKDKGPLSKMLPSSSKERSNKLPQRSIVNI